MFGRQEYAKTEFHEQETNFSNRWMAVDRLISWRWISRMRPNFMNQAAIRWMIEISFEFPERGRYRLGGSLPKEIV